MATRARVIARASAPHPRTGTPKPRKGKRQKADKADRGNQGPLPVVDFLKIPEQGDPYLEGHKCKTCSAVVLGGRAVCAKCGERGSLEPTKLSNQGTLYVYSIVHRSFPGIDVP